MTANPRLGIEQFDEQARSQFAAMKPKMNPFGEEKVARAFRGMDLFTKVLTNLCPPLSLFGSWKLCLHALRSRFVYCTNSPYGPSSIQIECAKGWGT